MQKISLAWYARLAVNLPPLLIGGLDTVELALTTFQAAWPYLAYLGDPKGPLSLDATRPAIWDIMRRGGEFLQAPEDQRGEILARNRQAIYQQAANLNILLDADLGHQSVYHVYPKRAYSIDKLIEDSASLFSPDVIAEFSEPEIFDIREAGKCLAFEVPTAAAFHLFRAVDTLLQRYTLAVAGSLPKSRNWGQYLAELEKHRVDPKIISVLRQLKDLYRNPVIHPEVRLTLDEGLSLIGIAESAVSLVVKDLIARRV